jgi:hypothetical protein
MLITLAFTMLMARPPAEPAMSPAMVEKLTLAAQQYGPPPANPAPKPPPPTGEQQNSAKGLYMSPTDDVWVYAHAEDPQKDQYLRAWGSNGRAIPLPGDDPQAFSWSLLKWDLSGFPESAKIVEAELIFTAAPDSGYTAKDAAAAPLEVRSVKSTFNEKDWDYANAETFMPDGDTGVFGTVSPATIGATEFPIKIDLLKGPGNFRTYYAEAMKKSKVIALAITSRIDPSQLGKAGIYKVYSKDATDPTMRPALRLVLLNPEKKKGR